MNSVPSTVVTESPAVEEKAQPPPEIAQPSPEITQPDPVAEEPIFKEEDEKQVEEESVKPVEDVEQQQQLTEETIDLPVTGAETSGENEYEAKAVNEETIEKDGVDAVSRRSEMIFFSSNCIA